MKKITKKWSYTSNGFFKSAQIIYLKEENMYYLAGEGKPLHLFTENQWESSKEQDALPLDVLKRWRKYIV